MRSKEQHSLSDGEAEDYYVGVTQADDQVPEPSGGCSHDLCPGVHLGSSPIALCSSVGCDEDGIIHTTVLCTYLRSQNIFM